VAEHIAIQRGYLAYDNVIRSASHGAAPGAAGTPPPS
jgi:hypothetical protein